MVELVPFDEIGRHVHLSPESQNGNLYCAMASQTK